MAPGIGAGGSVGFALEVTPGTYVAPTKFVPVNSESLKFDSEPNYRRPIRKSADVIWALPSDAHVNGDLEMDALEDVVPYFLLCARTSCVKGGAGPNYTYTFTPTATAIPAKTMSITVVRNGEVFGYTGCVVGSFTFSVSDGVLMFNCAVVGRDEADQTAPSETWPTTVPFGAGSYDIQIPTASTVLDSTEFELQVEDNAEPQFRLKSTGRGAQFIKYGEREVSLSVTRDFETRDDYDAFKAVTATSVTVTAAKTINNSIGFLVRTAMKNSYEVGLSSQGDLLTAELEYTGIHHASGAYEIVVKTQENITL
jgi:hypothetical protein